jgi:ADP-heptose:LPS heptosyltransferase
MMKSKRFGEPTRPERILVIRLGALGDVLRTLPAVSALRDLYPVSHLCWLVEPASASAVSLAGCADETLVFPRGELLRAARRGDLVRFVTLARGFFRRLRSRRFDLVLDFHGIAKSGFFAWASGSPVRCGFASPVAREGSTLFTNVHVDLASSHSSRFERNAALVRSLSAAVEVPSGPLLAATATARGRLESQLETAGRRGATGFVLIHPGTSERARHKRYATSAWLAVANRLCDAGLEVWIAGGPTAEEQSLVEQIVSGAKAGVVAAPRTASFDDLVALIERAAVFVACDSGPLHAATLVGVPVVQLLGPTDPVHNEPGSASPWRRVHVPLPCSPCRRGCADPACMRAIAPARVAEVVRALRASTGDERGRAAAGT